mmetsp:Transcript_69416/g.214521  ORF Transcript_69416/g.214521 Transcript_69416/m.214521 type:complete len:338 (-) Transcript_69416:185-1198(-)
MHCSEGAKQRHPRELVPSTRHRHQGVAEGRAGVEHLAQPVLGASKVYSLVVRLEVPVYPMTLEVGDEVLHVPQRLLQNLLEVLLHLRRLPEAGHRHPAAKRGRGHGHQDLLDVLEVQRAGKVDEREVEDAAGLLVEEGHHAQVRGWEERQVVAAATRCLEAQRALELRACLRYEVDGVALLPLERRSQHDLGLEACLGPEGEVEATREAGRGRLLIALALGSQVPDAALVVDLGHPPQRELRLLEELLEGGFHVVSGLHSDALLQAAQELVNMAHGLHDELLGRLHLGRDLGLGSHAAPLLVHRAPLQVVALPLRGVAERGIGRIDEADLLLRPLSV